MSILPLTTAISAAIIAAIGTTTSTKTNAIADTIMLMK